MAISIQVAHMEKRVAIAAGLNRHITRQQFVTEGETRQVAVWVPNNADPTKTKGNVELVSRTVTLDNGKTCDLTLQQAVNRRIREAGIKPRKGQATCLEIILSGSHDRMVAMSRKELLQWAKDSVKWAQKTWGKENVVSASLHVDEKTPHIHLIVVPIVTGQSRRTRRQQSTAKSSRKYNIDHTKLRLCVNEVYTTGKLYSYHDSYAKEVSNKYGMERGERAEPGSKKKHTNSIEYNRMLAAQAEERRSLIEELTSDYESRKTEIQEDIQQLQGKVNTLSSAVEDEERKKKEAEEKARKAEQDSRKAEERLSVLEDKIQHNEGVIKQRREVFDEIQGKIEKNKGIIDKQVADFNARKEELAKTKTDIAANKETIAQQKQTISANEATLQKQEKQKSSTVISDDAADKKILEQLQTVKRLEEEEARLSRSIVSKKTELATADANLQKRLRMIDAKANLDDVPKKGAFGYNSDKVTAFIESVEMASLKRAMYWTPTDIKVDTAIQEENTRLRQVEDEYKDFMNSPERMQQRIDELKEEKTLHRITASLQYVIRKEPQVISTTPTKDKDVFFVKYKVGKDPKEYTSVIKLGAYVWYTLEPMSNYEEVQSRKSEKIWGGGDLNKIREAREREDTLTRYTTKLSILTESDLKVVDYVTDGKNFLLFASDGGSYFVDTSGSTWRTTDTRIQTLEDCSSYGKEKIWKKMGNINNPEPGRFKGLHR